VLTNASLIVDIYNVSKRVNREIDTLNRAHLIATLYVVKNPNKFKERIKMNEKFKFNIGEIGGKISNRTKAIGAMTLLLGAGTALSFISDKKNVSAADMIESAREAVEEVVDLIPASDDDVTNF
jgi:hypothetical protein